MPYSATWLSLYRYNFSHYTAVHKSYLKKTELYKKSIQKHLIALMDWTRIVSSSKNSEDSPLHAADFTKCSSRHTCAQGRSPAL